MIPTLYCNLEYAVFDGLVDFFQHRWHLGILTATGPQIPAGVSPEIFLHLLAAHHWKANLQHLDAKIKDISFNELRKPDMNVNSTLHNHREDLYYLHNEVIKTRAGIRKGLEDHFLALLRVKGWSHLDPFVPTRFFDEMIKDSEKLSQFLMESFQLLLSSVSTKDAQTSLEQANRGARLTQLAFIYLPLSFLTGIFGMNIRQINGSGPAWWVLLVGLVIIAVCTIFIFAVLKWYGDRQSQKEKEKDIDRV